MPQELFGDAAERRDLLKAFEVASNETSTMMADLSFNSRNDFKSLQLTVEIPLPHPEVEGTEALAGEDPGAVGESPEDVLQMLVHLGPEGEVVDEDDGWREDVASPFAVEEVALEQLELREGLAVKGHPELEVLLHFLSKSRWQTSANGILRCYQF